MSRRLSRLPEDSVFGKIILIVFLPVLVVLGVAFIVLVLTLAVATYPFRRARRAYRNATAGHPGHWLRTRLGRGKSIAELARRLDMTIDELVAFQPSYREVDIPKRSGGTRRLHVPDPATKELQRRILRRVLRGLRAHSAARGFERGLSIVDNARPHVGQAVVIRLDVVDFFPSTQAERLTPYFQRIGWSRSVAELLTRLVTHEGGLPQGAPTSPRLSNLVNYLLDVQLTTIAARRKGTYTRYADDITFSFPKDYPRRVRGVVQNARRILRVYGYAAHRDRKLGIFRRHQRQSVTGLVVNDKINLPRATRRWLRAVEHRLRTGRPATLSENQLAGWRGLRQMIAEQSGSPGGDT